MRVVFRVDSSTDMSSGHLMRCLALASVMKKEEGVDIQFISRKCEGNLNDLVKKRGFKVVQLRNYFRKNVVDNNPSIEKRGGEKFDNMLGVPQKQDALDTISAIGATKVDWIIIDHYLLDDIWKFHMKPYTNKFFEFDDLFRPTKYSNVVLNQAPIKVSKENYRDKLTSKTKLLLGPKYAIIDETFLSVRKNLKPHRGEIARILVSYGGTDKSNETSKALNAIKNFDLSKIRVDVVIGERNLHADKIVKEVSVMKNIELHFQLPTLAKLMVKADLAIGAGGGTTWERIYLGLPSIVTTNSDDQIAIPYLNEHGYLFWVGKSNDVSQKDLENKIGNLIQNPSTLINQSLRCMKFLDGKGSKRIIKILKEDLGQNVNG